MHLIAIIVVKTFRFNNNNNNHKTNPKSINLIKIYEKIRPANHIS